MWQKEREEVQYKKVYKAEVLWRKNQNHREGKEKNEKFEDGKKDG